MQANIEKQSADKRLDYLLQQVQENRQIWILTDEHGCVMLNSEEEDCVPIWPSKDYAESWATDEWEHCKAEAIELGVWQTRWTPGLTEDEVSVAVFPNQYEEGLVLFPYEFEQEIKSFSAQRRHNA